MESQIHFLTPAIAGIVVGITSMITKIMIILSQKLDSMSKLSSEQNLSAVLSILGGGNAIPTFHFQLIVGLYVIQITFILSILVNGVENGDDPLNEKYLLGKNLISATLTYILIALSVVIILNIVAGSVISAIGTT